MVNSDVRLVEDLFYQQVRGLTMKTLYPEKVRQEEFWSKQMSMLSH